MTSHIFVSHSHLDNDFVTRLAQDLRRVLKDENAVWYDVLGLHGGDTWWEKIVEELVAREVFLLILSPDAMNSPWVRRELNMAWNKNKSILPVLLRACTIRADLEILQIISFLAPKPYEVAFQEVLTALGLPTNTPVELKDRASQLNDPASALLRQMEAAFAAQDWPDVIRKADFLIKRQPESATATVYRLQGVAYLEEGEEQYAQEALETALALVSEQQQRLTLLSDYSALLAKQKQWAKVLKRAKEALRLVPNDPGWLTTQEQAQSQLKGETATQSKSEGQAQTRAKETPPLPQKTKEQWLAEGNTHSNAKQYREALADFDRAIQLDSQYALAYSNRGVAYYALKEYQKAIADYDRAIQLNPQLDFAYHYRGIAYYDLKEYQKAIADFDRAIQLNPQNAEAYYSRGLTYYDLKEYQKAIADYDRAIQLDPNYVWAIENRGAAYYNLKQYQKAIADYDRAIQLDPKKVSAYHNRGIAYSDLKQYQQAIADFDRTIQLDPNYTLAKNNRETAYRALQRGA